VKPAFLANAPLLFENFFVSPPFRPKIVCNECAGPESSCRFPIGTFLLRKRMDLEGMGVKDPIQGERSARLNREHDGFGSLRVVTRSECFRAPEAGCCPEQIETHIAHMTHKRAYIYEPQERPLNNTFVFSPGYKQTAACRTREIISCVIIHRVNLRQFVSAGPGQ
jgi:hypothetical protein